MQFAPEKDRLLTILSHALVEVSGLPVTSVADAERILAAIPSTVRYRVFVIYKGSSPPGRMFTTLGLYKAPEPNTLIRKFEEAATEEEVQAEQFSRQMEQRFGREEMLEQRRNEELMFRNSKGRGVTLATPDEMDTPKPQPRTDDGKGLGTRPPKKMNSYQPPTPTPTPAAGSHIGSVRKEVVEPDVEE